jgi:hypothetical protein
MSENGLSDFPGTAPARLLRGYFLRRRPFQRVQPGRSQLLKSFLDVHNIHSTFFYTVVNGAAGPAEALIPAVERLFISDTQSVPK